MEQLGEYDAETPLSRRYCKQLTEEEYEQQTANTTYDALQELMQYVEENPEVYKRIIAKRKLEEEENAGLLSFLKVKLMVALQGEDYGVDTISNDDCEKGVNKFNSDICEVFNYSQDSKTKAKRFSKRLEAKKIKEKESAKIPSSKPEGKIQTAPPAPSVSPFQLGIDLKNSEKVVVSPRGRPSIHQGNKKQKKRPTEESLMSPPPAPPPPPPPPPPAGILKDSTNKKSHRTHSTPDSRIVQKMPASDGKLLTKKLRKEVKHHGSTASLASIGSIHDELKTFDRKLLRSVNSIKSPGGTPLPTPRTRRLMTTPVTSPTVNSMFNTMMLDKFKNIRSPPSNQNSPASGFNSTSDFTP